MVGAGGGMGHLHRQVWPLVKGHGWCQGCGWPVSIPRWGLMATSVLGHDNAHWVFDNSMVPSSFIILPLTPSSTYIPSFTHLAHSTHIQLIVPELIYWPTLVVYIHPSTYPSPSYLDHCSCWIYHPAPNPLNPTSTYSLLLLSSPLFLNSITIRPLAPSSSSYHI